MKHKTSSEIFSDQISLTLDSVELDNPNSFIYQDVNLRYALERDIYFSYANEKQSWEKKVKQIPNIQNTKEVSVLNIIFSFPQKVALLINNLLRIVKGKAKELLSKHILNFTSSYDEFPLKGKVLFYCHVLKTAKYFHDIFDVIGRDSCAIIRRNQDYTVSKYAEHEKIGSVSLHRAGTLCEKLNLPLSHPLYSSLRRLALQYDGVRDILTRLKPLKIVFSEGTSSNAELISQASKSFNIKTIRIQYGKATSLHSGYRNMSFDEMLMWGEGFAERLYSISPKPKYFNVGHFLLDRDISEVSVIRKSLGIRDNCLVITILTQPVCANLSEKEYDILINYALFMLNVSKQIIIIIRKHPADYSKKFDNIASQNTDRIRVLVSGEVSLLENLSISTYVISFNSTTISEAIACNVLPIIISIDSVGLTFPYPERFGAAVLSSSAEDAKNISLNLLDDNELIASYSKSMKKFTKKYFHKMDGKSLDRVCNHILYDIE